MKFPKEWNVVVKANVVPIHKKMINSASKITDLSLCFRFERLLFNELKKFLNENYLLSSNQSGFRRGDFCINQLLSVTHKIYQSFDDDLEVRGVFLDIFKAFDKVWHEVLILKLSRNGKSGNLLHLLKDFLKYRKQRVVLKVLL